LATGKVLVFGSINTDFVTYIDRLPEHGETVGGGEFSIFAGGKGANQAVAAAKAGAGVELYGCLGTDSLAKDRIASLKEAGVSTTNIVIKNGTHSGIAQILVDSRGENIIAVAPGANGLFTPSDITIPDSCVEENTIALFQNEIPQATTETLISKCKKSGTITVWNLAPVTDRVPLTETFTAVDYLVCNRSEIMALAGKDDIEINARVLIDRGVPNVIVTLGEKGSLLVSETGVYYQDSFKVNVVDTVGSGDCFCGVFAGSLSSGMSVKDALKRASAAAALAATVKGAQNSMPSAQAIDTFLCTGY